MGGINPIRCSIRIGHERGAEICPWTVYGQGSLKLIFSGGEACQLEFNPLTAYLDTQVTC